MDSLALINIIIQLASISEELHIVCLQNVSLSPLATFQCFKPFVKVQNLCHAVDVAYLGLSGKQDGGYT